ncbi:MAG: 5'/3'-nucleotidase SurE [Oscillospiraceae bacterium]|nr:5'/3'-nucleotidase SurE [Oscillospiraceae bacterium]
MHTILITNDDGIMADVLYRLAKEAQNFGKVYIVAPDGQRSTASHSITLHGTIDVFLYEYPLGGVKVWTCSGTPADCVRVGSLYLMPQKPDIVLSGINKGYNTATDIQYSGTVGAALKAAFQGCKGIAISEQDSDCHEVTDYYLHDLLAELLETELLPDQILNVNIPGCKLSECKGILRNRTVSRSMFFTDRYRKITDLPKDGIRLEVDGLYGEEAEEGTDMWAVIDRYISIGFVNRIH